MMEVPAESVHLIITSPPYWQLKDYGNSNQIGYNDSYEEYINNLNLVWSECHRILHNGCRLCINIGDQFARSVYYGRYKVIPIRTEIIRFCETIGFDYMGAVIWQKVTTCNTTGGATIMGSFPYPRNGILKLDYEFILIFKKYGNPPTVTGDRKQKSKLTVKEWNEYFAGHWYFPGERQAKHLAMFPVELPHRLIRMFSFIGDTILDPFLGSGTTSLAARQNGRNSIGYEINVDYMPIIKDKFGLHQVSAFDESLIEFVVQENGPSDYSDRIRALPYIFKDPIKFDKKVDPKKLMFGSKIDSQPADRQEALSVREIVSPELLVLENGLRIRLLGVKENSTQRTAAIRYLSERLKGQKVFMKYDDIIHDEHNNLYCYLYLKNKTFLNAHLIRSNLVDVDVTLEYRMKRKFLDYRRIA